MVNGMDSFAAIGELKNREESACVAIGWDSQWIAIVRPYLWFYIAALGLGEWCRP